MKNIITIVILILLFGWLTGTNFRSSSKESKGNAGIDSIENISDTDRASGGFATFGDISWKDIMKMDSSGKRAFYLSLTDSLPDLWMTRDVDAMSEAIEDSLPSFASNDVIYLYYRQKVNGYRVWVEFDRSSEQMGGRVGFSNYVGRAILHFSKPQHSFDVYCEEFSDEALKVWDLTDTTLYKKKRGFFDLSKLKGGETVHLDYIRPKKGEYLSDSSPFYFKDMDYDGEEELVVNNIAMGIRGYNTYDVFKIFHVSKPLRLVGPPFTDQSYKITNYNVEYEPSKKCVLDKRYDGFDAYGYYRYQSVLMNTENGQRRAFILKEAEDMDFYHLNNSHPSDSIVLIQPFKKYERINGKIFLSEKGVYEIGCYGHNNNRVILH